MKKKGLQGGNGEQEPKNKQQVLSVLSVLVFATLFVLSLVQFMRQDARIVSDVIAQDVANLERIFTTIDKQCGITSFEHQANNIDFLNTISFAGSEVGPMNLLHPKKWQGPYLQDNPTVEEIYYSIVKTKHGHFIVPGNGTVLSNGKQIGKDIQFDFESDIPAMLKDESLLLHKGRPLARSLSLSHGR